MKVIKNKAIFYMIAVLVATFMLTQTVQARDIGPLPPLNVCNKAAELGRKLFFDTKLSGDGQRACSHCHNPKLGFTTRDPLAEGYISMQHYRNTPTLINTAYKGSKLYRIPWHWDGRIGTSLNDMTRDAITSSQIMQMDMRIMQERLKQFPAYVKEFKAVFKSEPSNILVRKAIPEFIKTLTSKNVPFDKGNLGLTAQAGLDLFRNKAGCIRCHNGPLFTDGRPHNTGLPENPEIFRNPSRHITFLSVYRNLGVENYMNLRRDPGYSAVSHNTKDMGKFVTPTLRELKYTGPYMHNGLFETLDQVIEFYNMGGGPDRPGLKDSAMVPLHLSETERAELKEFLLTLSGDPVVVEEVIPDLDYQPLENWLESAN